jgi:hypothetical protein
VANGTGWPPCLADSSYLVKVSEKVPRGTKLKVTLGTPVLGVIPVSCTTITRNYRAHVRRVKVKWETEAPRVARADRFGRQPVSLSHCRRRTADYNVETT